MFFLTVGIKFDQVANAIVFVVMRNVLFCSYDHYDDCNRGNEFLDLGTASGFVVCRSIVIVKVITDGYSLANMKI